mgnify:CR=1 FL=1
MRERSSFATRHRRLRSSAAIRGLVRETSLSSADLIAPLFVVDDAGAAGAVDSMPGVQRFAVDGLLREVESLVGAGVQAVAVFPCIDPARKDERGSHALDADNLACTAVRALRREFPELAIVADVALDPYTSHGHDGVLEADGRDVDNDTTVGILAQMACHLAAAGTSIVAPSDMMDGRVAAIRDALDSQRLAHTAILSYAAKFASSLYGPFRDALGSARNPDAPPIDKRGYQIEPANRRQAVDDALQDIAEGADILMVKPAGWYLDVLAELRRDCRLPLAAYQISGEYAQIHAAAANGWITLADARDESLLAIKRAGADMILTYFAADAARALQTAG